MAAKRWSPEQRARLGALLEERREELDPRYYVREVFAAERGINLRMAADLEKGRPRNFTPLTIRDVVAPAYGVEAASVTAAADGGELVALPGTAPHRRRPRAGAVPVRATAPDSVVMAFGEDATARAQSFAARIFMRRSDWRAAYASAHPGIEVAGIPEPPGADLFGPDTHDATSWDHHVGELEVDELVWLIARLQARRAEVRGRESGTG